MNLQEAKERLMVNGFLNLPEDENIDYIAEIKRLKKEKNAVILAHYYQTKDIQEIADYLGDSLYLAQQAAKTEADVIVFAGVHFMAETAKILNPTKKVLLPDLHAGCSLAESCPPKEFAAFKKQYPDHKVVTYINCSADIKALSDIVCTSSNAVKVINSFPEDQKLIFAPDRNLGAYLNKISGKEMVLWDGACIVHEAFSLDRIIEVMKANPKAKLIAHPESQAPLLNVADFIGSTSQLLSFVQEDDAEEFIIATEEGILHEMRKYSPNKKFIPAPVEDESCACSECHFMKLNNMRKLYLCLKYDLPEVVVDLALAKEAIKPIRKMLDLS